MEINPGTRPRVSRETRLLLSAALLAVLALWVLARLRFPDASEAQSAVAPLLAPLVPRATFEDLAGMVADARFRMGPRLLAVNLTRASPRLDAAMDAKVVAALRIGEDTAIALEPPGATAASDDGVRVTGRDAPTGLVALRVPRTTPLDASRTWTRREPVIPRYFVRSDAFVGGVSLQPVWVGALFDREAPLWSSTVWAVPPDTDIKAGSFLFTLEGEFVGLTVQVDASPAVLPASAVLESARRIQSRADLQPATLGAEVQALTAAIERASGATSGVAVSWVSEGGPARGQLMPGDVLEGADGRALPSLDHWRRFLADLLPDAPVVLRVRRQSRVIDVALTTTVAPLPPDASRTPRRVLGLSMRRLPGRGSEILAVEPLSMAAGAGLRVGDVITMAGGITQPTPSRVRRAIAAARPDRPVMVTVQRGTVHHLAAIEP